MGKTHLHRMEHYHVSGVKENGKLRLCGHEKTFSWYYILSNVGRETMASSLDDVNELW